jgi:Zn-dependent peptidase ImmA (M78 family)
MEALGQNMKYKDLYIGLAHALTYRGCEVCDYDYWGYCAQTDGIRAFIVIKPKMKYKEKYLILVHETGHLFFLNNKKGLVWSNKTRNEDQANQFALKFLKMNKIDAKEYNKFYKKAQKIAKKRKKSWHEF